MSWVWYNLPVLLFLKILERKYFSHGYYYMDFFIAAVVKNELLWVLLWIFFLLCPQPFPPLLVSVIPQLFLQNYFVTIFQLLILVMCSLVNFCTICFFHLCCMWEVIYSVWKMWCCKNSSLDLSGYKRKGVSSWMVVTPQGFKYICIHTAKWICICNAAVLFHLHTNIALINEKYCRFVSLNLSKLPSYFHLIMWATVLNTF